MNLFMRTFQDLEDEYNSNKQALREARIDIQKAEDFADKYNASAVVCVRNGLSTVWVQASRELFTMLVVENGVLSEETIAGKHVYIIDGVKVIAC